MSTSTFSSHSSTRQATFSNFVVTYKTAEPAEAVQNRRGYRVIKPTYRSSGIGGYTNVYRQSGIGGYSSEQKDSGIGKICLSDDEAYSNSSNANRGFSFRRAISFANPRRRSQDSTFSQTSQRSCRTFQG